MVVCIVMEYLWVQTCSPFLEQISAGGQEFEQLPNVTVSWAM